MKSSMVFYILTTPLLLANCGGGSSGDNTNNGSFNSNSINDSDAPTVSSTIPANNASSIARNSIISATFNEDILNTSVDNNVFNLHDTNNTSISGSVGFDGLNNIITFAASDNLQLLTAYTATLNASITDLNGNPLASNISWQFTTADGIWGTSTLLETQDLGSASKVQIAFSNDGNAIAVWQQSDGVRDNIWSNLYTVGTGWGTPTLVENDNTGHARTPKIAIDHNGNAMAVWRQYDGSIYNIYSSRYTPASGWGSSNLLENNNVGTPNDPQIAFDSNGNAMAVWEQYDGTSYNVYSNYYTNGSGWGLATLIETNNSGPAYDPQLAFNANDDAIAVWEQNDGSRYNIYSNTYNHGSGWSTPTLIETNNDGPAYDPQLSVNTEGTMIAAWRQYDGTRYSIYSNRYTTASEWETATLIETNNVGNAENVHVAISNSGHAFAVWPQHDGTRNNIWGNRYTQADGWGTATLLENNDTASAYSPQIAVDNNGHAFAIWSQLNTTQNNTWVNRYINDQGWGSPELIETDNTGDVFDPQIVIDNNGYALGAWAKYNGSRYNVWSNRFD